MERNEQRRIVEALVLASPEPISAARLGNIVPDGTDVLVRDLVGELNEGYAKQDCAFEIWEVAGGFQIRTRAEFSGYLQQLQKQRPLRLSQAALETLSIVAYKQPATRAEVEAVRGVEVGAVIKTLMERQLVRMVGRRDVPGRPMLYGTTRRFLEIFGLESVKDLPRLKELEELAREQGLAVADTENAGDSEGEVESSAEPSVKDGGAIDEAADTDTQTESPA